MPQEFYDDFEMTTGVNTDNTWLPKLFEQTLNCRYEYMYACLLM